MYTISPLYQIINFNVSTYKVKWDPLNLVNLLNILGGNNECLVEMTVYLYVPSEYNTHTEYC